MMDYCVVRWTLPEFSSFYKTPVHIHLVLTELLFIFATPALPLLPPPSQYTRHPSARPPSSVRIGILRVTLGVFLEHVLLELGIVLTPERGREGIERAVVVGLAQQGPE